MIVNLDTEILQQEQTHFQRGWKRSDQEESLSGPWKSGELCNCEDKPLSFVGDGIPKINIFDKYLIDWTLGLWPFFFH